MPEQISIIEKVEHTIQKYNMLEHGLKVVLALSGGPDSVCLLHLLCELKNKLGLTLIIAHLDHGLRPEEDKIECRFVEKLALSYGLPMEIKKAGQELNRSQAGSLEEKARDFRYRFLEQVKNKYEADRIALGHNLNDQAETLLMRLLRGSGLTGLSSIPPVRNHLFIRPLIEVSRPEVMKYLEAHGYDFMTDSSNLETGYLRNRIRLELLPQLESYQPRIINILAQTASILRRDNDWLDSETKKWVKKNTEIKTRNEYAIPLTKFRQLPDALKTRAIRYVLKEIAGGNLRRINARHLEAINQIAFKERPQSRYSLPKGIVVQKVYDRLVIFKPNKDSVHNFCYTIKEPGHIYLNELGLIICLEEVDSHTIKDSDLCSDPWIAFFDLKKITYPLIIRNMQSGDKFIPFGMKGHKKIKDFFIDLKIPSEQRIRVPLLTLQNRPIWVCGYRIDDRYKIISDTSKALKIIFKQAPGTGANID